MTDPPIAVRVERSEADGIRVLAPAVGRWGEPPADGSAVGPGSVVGRLRVLNRRYLLVMPEGVTGTVERGGRGREVGVAYGELLFRVREVEAGVAHSPRGGGGRERTSATGLPPGAHAVTAPTDGVFYRRPSPDAPSFVEVGSVVREGQPVGLVEVMKTFNQIAYGGPGLPAEGRVLEIRCDDGTEVHAGQVLVVLEAASG